MSEQGIKASLSVQETQKIIEEVIKKQGVADSLKLTAKDKIIKGIEIRVDEIARNVFGLPNTIDKSASSLGSTLRPHKTERTRRKKYS